MVSITNFKLQIESLGNFLWTGGESELNKLKAWLYEKTKSCKEITQMGWQREGFFCWGNGIRITSYNVCYTKLLRFKFFLWGGLFSFFFEHNGHFMRRPPT